MEAASSSTALSLTKPLPLFGGSVAFTQRELKQHIGDLSTERHRWILKLSQLLRRLMEHKSNRGLFNTPVDPVALRIPTYLTVIKSPMDLGTIKTKIETGDYLAPNAFYEDVCLTFDNALKFNAPNHYIYKCAKELLQLFKTEFAKTMKGIKESYDKELKHSCINCLDKQCSFCKSKCLNFQIPVIRCSIPCKARIQRNATYYRYGGERGQHWCLKCFTSLPDEFDSLFGKKLNKDRDLEQRVNDEVFAEPWVDCMKCSRSFHQICALYNCLVVDQFRKKHAELSYVCPLCVLENVNINSNINDEFKLGKMVRPPLVACANTLPQTCMGRFLEGRVRQASIKTLVENKFSVESSEEIANGLTVRVVSCHRVITKGESRLRRWIEAQGKSMESDIHCNEYPHVSKTIVLFQKIHGVDVLLFVLYVQEYGSECPYPNKKKIYISYLDSVSFMRPRVLRTVVYHEVLASYFEWVRARGFQHVYIWACPPQRGDAYILYCHPKWQRTPSGDRLKKWYSSIIQQCIQKKVVLSETNIYKQHFAAYKPLVNTRATSISHTGSDSSNGAGMSIQTTNLVTSSETINTTSGGKPMSKLFSSISATNLLSPVAGPIFSSLISCSTSISQFLDGSFNLNRLTGVDQEDSLPYPTATPTPRTASIRRTNGRSTEDPAERKLLETVAHYREKAKRKYLGSSKEENGASSPHSSSSSESGSPGISAAPAPQTALTALSSHFSSSASSNTKLEPVPSSGTASSSSTAAPPTPGDVEADVAKCLTGIQKLPYFYGDYIPTEIEATLSYLEKPKVAGEAMSDIGVKVWWTSVWGKHKIVKVESEPELSDNDATAMVTSDVDDPPQNQSKAKDKKQKVASQRALSFEIPVPLPRVETKPTVELSQVKDFNLGGLSALQRNDWLMRRIASQIKPMKDNFMVLKLTSLSGKTNKRKVSEANVQVKRLKVDGVVTSLKPRRSVDATYEHNECFYFDDADHALHHVVVTTCLDGEFYLKSDTVDPDPLIRSNIFDTRLALLDMCQTNNFQFDQLRRAKHSSMALLTYLHQNQ